ncbi:hypothetical protein [Niabella beijingensis]|uniref:hypothetical protein n=1 Tax=Niabella beijingensis TaxID=2872700 RepID=UPI001CBEBB12|nr:hypothetical protein [Niabella beijingensis]MBZ4188518.1 hypothetical protein [Niabella beijingensis]
MINKNNEILFMVCEPDPGYKTSGRSPREIPGFDEDDFNPAYHFLHLVKSHPFHCLSLVLSSSQLEQLQSEWQTWAECAVCAEHSVFSNDNDRKYLLRFSENFRVLMDALHHTVGEWMKMKKQKMALYENDAIYRYLPETGDACRLILGFTERYPEKKARIYLWSVLDCVLGEGEHFGIARENILFDYESLLCMLRAPYHMIRQYPSLFGRAETPGQL